MGVEAAIIGAAVVGAAGSAIGAGMTNSAQAEMAAKANAQSQRNSDTAHQREVIDLRAAGLNPILSAGGNGAPVPQYNVPTFSNPLSGLADAMSQGITNATAYQGTKQIDPQIDKIQSEANLNKSLTLKAAADTTSALSTSRRNDAETASLKSSPLVSKFLGSDAATSLQSFTSNSVDTISDKIGDIIKNINTSSAKKVKSPVSIPPMKNPDPLRGFIYSRDANGIEHYTNPQ